MCYKCVFYISAIIRRGPTGKHFLVGMHCMKTDGALRLLVSLSDLTLALNLRFLSLW